MALLLKFIKTRCAALIVKKQSISAAASGWLSTKIHAKVDDLVRLLRIELSEGQRHESQMTDRILDSEACDYLLEDRAYDSDWFI